MICPKCNHDNPNDATFCQSCGEPMNEQKLQQSQDNNNSASQPVPGKGNAIAAMVLGIIGCVFCWWGVVNIISLALSIVGLILAIKARKEMVGGVPGRGMATAGLVLSIIGLVLSGIGVLACTAFVGILGAAGSSLGSLGY